MIMHACEQKQTKLAPTKTQHIKNPAKAHHLATYTTAIKEPSRAHTHRSCLMETVTLTTLTCPGPRMPWNGTCLCLSRISKTLVKFLVKWRRVRRGQNRIWRPLVWARRAPLQQRLQQGSQHLQQRLQQGSQHLQQRLQQESQRPQHQREARRERLQLRLQQARFAPLKSPQHPQHHASQRYPRSTRRNPHPKRRIRAARMC